MQKSSLKYAVCFLADVPHILPALVKAHVDRWANAANGMAYPEKLAEFQTFYMSRTGISVCFVATDGNDWVGFVRMKPPAESGLKESIRHPLISGFQVKDTHRGHGIGKALLCAVMEHALREGHETLNVWADSTDYYDRHQGFKPLGPVEKKEGGIARLYEADVKAFLKAYTFLPPNDIFI